MNIVPFTYFADKLPNKFALRKGSKYVSSLSGLYKAVGNKYALSRYGRCWDYFPNDLTEKDLSLIINMLRRFFESKKEQISLTIKSNNCEFFYENINRSQIKRMLHCAYALKQDLYMVNK